MPYGHPNEDTIYINEIEFDNWDSFRVIKKLNGLWTFEIRLEGIESGDQTNVQENKIVKIFSENNLVLKGKIETVEYESEYSCVIRGYDMAATLLHRDLTRKEHAAVASNTIVSKIASENYDGASPWIINVGTNTNLGNETIRFEYDNRLRAIAAVAKYWDGDWWITNTGADYGTDNINVSTSKGTGTSLQTFSSSGATQNVAMVSREVDMENLVNDVTVLGYGDGVNQVSVTSNDGSGDTYETECTASIAAYGRRQRTYTDRSLTSTTAAQEIADNIIKEQLNSAGDNVVPAERIILDIWDVHQTTVDVGDTITVVDDDTVLDADYEIMQIERSNDFQFGPRLLLNCSNKKLSMLDELENTEKNVNNLDKYMQGSTNCYMTGETDNCDSSNGLRIDFFVPEEVVAVNSVKLNYNLRKYRVWSTTTPSGGGDTSGNESTLTVNFANAVAAGNANIGADWTTITTLAPSTNTAYCIFQVHITNNDTTATYRYFRLQDATGSTYSPQEDGVLTWMDASEHRHQESGNGSYTENTSLIDSTTLTFILPGNVNGHTLNLQAKGTGNVGYMGTWFGIGTHTHSTPDHTHTLTYGIGTDAAAWGVSDVSISVDGVDQTSAIETAKGSALVNTENGTEDGSHMELKDYLDTPIANAWHYVIITPNNNCRIKSDMYVQVFIKSE